MKQALRAANARKAAGPDEIPVRIYHHQNQPEDHRLRPRSVCIQRQQIYGRCQIFMIIKSADDTTVLGLLSNGNEVVYRDEVQSLSTNIKNKQTKEIITGFRQQRRALRPLELGGEEVKRVSCFKLLGIPSMKTLNGQQTLLLL